MEEQEFLEKFGLALDAQQLTAMRAAQGPVLLLAVPGSGKTTVLLARLGYLIYCCGVPPTSILTMTYTVAATQEMRARFAQRFEAEVAAQLRFATINSVCVQVLKQFERMTGRKPFELVVDGSKTSAMLREIWLHAVQDHPTEADLRAVKVLLTYIKNQMLGKEEIEALEAPANHTKIAPIYEEYTQRMREKHWMDYDDQMVYALQILRRYPAILQSFRQQYRYLCVDEAQDTSKIQHSIIRLLAADSGNLFMVGDEDQSIYGFRAACPQALLDFEKDWQGARVLFLEHNYRSTPQIVRRADEFIARNLHRREKHMYTENPGGAAVQRFVCQDREAQYAWLAKLAEDANQNGVETAVLYRDNDSALPVIDLLTRKGIPYRAKGVDGLFFTGRVVRDITDILLLAFHPADGDAFLRVYYKFKSGISRVHAESAAAQARAEDKSVFSALRGMDLQGWTRTQVQRLELNFKGLQQDTASTALQRIINEMNYQTYLEESGMRTGALDILCALAAQSPTPQQLLHRLEELQHIVREGSGAAQASFVLSTIHSSKGLEYERVVLADVVDGILPQDPACGILPTPEQLEALEEDRRLFYVGMTRAKKQLTLVTFTRIGLHSTFAEQLFPPPLSAKPKAPRKTAIHRGGDAVYAGYVMPAQGERQIAGYMVNAAVRHNKYGTGKIVKRKDDRVTILFENGTERSFLLGAALQAGALSLL